jgi:RHS repeat-associated protein
MKRVYKKAWAIILIISMIFGIAPGSVKAESKTQTSNDAVSDAYSDNSVIQTDNDIQEEPTVLYELEDEREENSKRFLMSDHTIQAIMYSEPVHYSEEGEWKDIDNTLSLEAAQDSEDFTGYTNAQAGFDVKIAEDASEDNLVRIEKDNHKIEFNLVDDQTIVNNDEPKANIKEKDNSNYDNQFELSEIISEEALKVNSTSDTVVYEGITDHNATDIEYQVTGSGLKENIIINNKQDEYHYTFDLKADNLELELKDNKIDAYDPQTKKEVFHIPAPFMYDVTGEMSTEVSYSLDKTGTGYQLTVSADKEWINGEGIQFPVTIDPIITTDKTEAAISSTFISSKMNTTNFFDGYAMLMVGVESSAYYNCRTLVKFKLPQLDKGDIINTAYINLIQYEVNAFSSDTPALSMNAYRITKDWNESTVNWDTKPTIDTNVVDFTYSNKEDGNSLITKSLDITKTVKSWYDGDVPNYGIMINVDKENTQNTANSIYAKFKSEKYNSVTDAYPVIVLNYRNSKGVEGYYSYTDVDAGNAGTAYVNNYSGNLYFEQKAITTSGLRMPASVYLTYNTNNSDMNHFYSGLNCGYGWKLNVEQYVKSTNISDFPYLYVDADGTEHYFKKFGSGTTATYLDEDGLGLSLVPYSDGYTIKDDHGNAMKFAASGILLSISDANENSITMTYSGDVIQSVTDGAGKKIIIKNSSGVLTQIIDPANRVTKYTINNNQLTNVTNPDGTVDTYRYSPANQNIIDSIQASNGNSLKFAYVNQGMRVASVAEAGDGGAGGQQIGFDYAEYNTTKLTTSGVDNIYGNADDIVTAYQFDDYGRLEFTQSKSGGNQLGTTVTTYSSSSTSAANIKKINRVTSSFGIGANAINLLKNHNAESLDNWGFIKAGTCNETVGLTSSQKYYGSKSINIGVAAATNGSILRYRQMLTNDEVVPDKTYTFSGYVKTSDLVPLKKETDGAALVVYSYYADGSTKSFYSEFISGNNDSQIDGGWRRLSVSFKVPQDAVKTSVNLMVKNTNGNVYFDGLQLEEGDTANPYNFLEDAGFENANSLGAYTGSNLSSADTIVKLSEQDYSFGKNAFVISGDKSITKSITQEVPISGKKTDTYIISGWAKAFSVPASIRDGSRDVDRKFKISVKVTYNDGYSLWKDAANYNQGIAGWQFGAVKIDLDDETTVNRTPVKLTIVPRYDYQANKVYFDNLSVTKENKSQYDYYDNGYLSTINDKTDKKIAVDYYDDNVTNGKNEINYITDAKGGIIKFYYEGYNLTEAVSRKGVRTKAEYDSFGNPVSTQIINSSSSMSIQADTSYTENGDYVRETRDQDNNTTSYNYDQSKGVLNSVTDQNKNSLNYTYDSDTDQLVRVSGLLKGQEISNIYEYVKDRLTKISHNGFSYNYLYNDFGNSSSIKVGDQTLASYQYGANNGNLDRVDYGNGDYSAYQYDSYGNIIQEDVGKGENNEARYQWYADNTGNLIKHEDLINKLLYRYEYDTDGRLIRQDVEDTTKALGIQRNAYLLEYAYDANDNITRFVNKAGSKTMAHTFAYDKEDLLTTYTMPTQKAVTYTYDSLNRLQTYQIGTATPVTVDYSYFLSVRNAPDQSLYRTTKVRYETAGNSVSKYDYDKVGNITSISEEQADGSYLVMNSYEYDELNQLIRENDRNQNKTKAYTYDLGGNIISIMEYAFTEGTVTDGQELNTINYEYSDANWKDKLTSYNGQPITYDAIGNPINYNGYTLGWSNGRELTTLSGNGVEASYTYDADGLRATKTVNGIKTNYEYAGGQLLYEKKGTTELHYFYDTNGSLKGIQKVDVAGVATNYYVVTNTRGDVTKIYDEAGILQASYTYDAWGKVLSIKDGNGNEITSNSNIGNLNSLRFRSYYYDDETGLFYVGSRYYNPEWGRFLNADAQVGVNGDLLGANVFAYCDNNPIMLYDPNGFDGQWIDLGKGWKARIDPADTNTLEQRHAHVYGDGKKYTQNKDGSPGDGSSGKPPKKVLKKLEEKTGWDWNKKAKAYDKHPTHYIINDGGDIVGYVTSTGKVKYYGGSGSYGFYFMPDFNFSLPSFNFNFSFNSIPIFGW